MTFQTFIKRLSQRLGTTQKETRTIYRAFCELVVSGLYQQHAEIHLKDLGTFKPPIRKERRYTLNGQEEIIPAHRVVTFTPAASLREMMKDGPIDWPRRDFNKELEDASNMEN